MVTASLCVSKTPKMNRKGITTGRKTYLKDAYFLADNLILCINVGFRVVGAFFFLARF